MSWVGLALVDEPGIDLAHLHKQFSLSDKVPGFRVSRICLVGSNLIMPSICSHELLYPMVERRGV